jgi:hypothetical protein
MWLTLKDAGPAELLVLQFASVRTTRQPVAGSSPYRPSTSTCVPGLASSQAPPFGFLSITRRAEESLGNFLPLLHLGVGRGCF